MIKQYKLKYPVSYYFEHADLLTEDDLDDCMEIIDGITIGFQIIEMTEYINSVRPWYRGKVNSRYAYRYIK